MSAPQPGDGAGTHEPGAETSAREPDNGAATPTVGRIVEIDLAVEPIVPPDTGGAEVVYVLLRWQGRPVGRLILEGGRQLSASRFRWEALAAAAAGMATALAEAAGPGEPLHLPCQRVSRGVEPANVSVVVASRDRAGELDSCLTTIRCLDPPPGELVVADSASRQPEETAAVAARHGARLVRLERPGLSRARNAGAREARGDVLAFIDDDCRVDPGWLHAICAGFEDDEVLAVTGQLLPAELATPAQRVFLSYFHMDLRGFVPRRFEPGGRPSPYWPLDSWRMGSGGNLAVRRGALLQEGGFSLALGLGTPARGGEDLFLLWRLMERGAAVVYRPDALAWHRHHRQWADLERVLFGYGAGHAAYLRAARRAGAPPRTVMLYTLSFAADRVLRLARSLVRTWPVPAGLVLRELAGSIAGPLLGRRAERALDAEARQASRASTAGSEEAQG
jgi:glycosyltransferase involved in cell wall biosynthesis